jgi:CRISPR/Cas system-associated exonuclease Cas4 (RecB family)
MNVICSIGKGEVSTAACLKCAQTGGRCGYDYVVLRKMFEGDQNEKRQTEIHVTDLLGCLKKAWYEKTQPKCEVVHELLVRSLGVIIHEGMACTNALVQTEIPLKYEDLIGAADILYEDGRLLDIKSTRWLMPDKVPYGSHELQVNLYAYMLEKMGKKVTSMQIQYIDTSGPTKCRRCRVEVRMINGELRCPVCGNYIKNSHLGAVLVDVQRMRMEDMESLIKDRKSSLLAAMITNMAPEASPGWACSSYCSYTDECEEQSEED